MASAALDNSTQLFLSTCPRDCYDACGLKVKTENGKVVQVVGDTQHSVSKGRLCKKCSIGYNSIWIDPDSRVTTPLRRVGEKGKAEFEAISWERAITEITNQFQSIIQESGPESILTTHYTGTFAAIGYHFPMRFFNRLGATEVNPDSVCNLAGHIALDYVVGSSLTGFDPRTSKDSKCIVVWGGNPSTAGPHTHEHWLTPQAEKLIVVDSIKTATADIAALHLQPYPGSDAGLAFAIMHVLEREGLIDEEFIENHTIGWESLKPSIETCTPKWCEEVSGVPASKIVDAARMYASGPALLWLGQGFQRQPKGGNAMRACSMLPAITGNVGRPGSGLLYLNGLNQRNIDDEYLLGSSLVNGEAKSISHMDLAEVLENSSRSQAIFCWNVNNVASSPEQARLKKALCREDLFTVVADVFPTDTTDYADIVLPAASFLESNDLFASYFDLTLSAQVKASEPLGDSLPNSEIFRRLAEKMGFTEEALFETDEQIIETLLDQAGVDETFESLSQKGTIDFSKEPVIQFKSLEFPTPSGKIEIASSSAESEGIPLVPDPHVDPRPQDGRLRLLSPASPWSLNSTFGSATKIDRQAGPTKVFVNPEDARSRDLNDGDSVVLGNEMGSIEMELSVSDDVLQGMVISYKGRWPKRDSSGSNINILNPGNKADMGESSCVHDIEVTIRPAQNTKQEKPK